MSAGVIRLSFPARAEYLILGRLALAGAARAVPISEETLADLKLAVTEACGNVVRHAYAGAGEGTVRLVLDVRHDAITITVEDDGVGLTHGAAANAAADALDEGGMGLAIIESIADELEIAPASPHGTVLTLRKRLEPQPVEG